MRLEARRIKIWRLSARRCGALAAAAARCAACAICGNSATPISSAVGQYHRPEHRILELAHVARPAIGGEQRQRLGADPVMRLPSSAAKRARKCRTSSGMSSGRSASGGTRDREHVQPVEQVLAEAAVPSRRRSGRGWWPR